MPMYTYRFLDEAGEPTGETVDVHQVLRPTLTEIDGRPVRRAIGNQFGWKAGFAQAWTSSGTRGTLAGILSALEVRSEDCNGHRRGDR